ncbi:MAG: hypothetical protein KDK65_04680, partial [Chlamydiia bacterium]|nr:hypothetical protein [Chlamydiia bacterium]
MGKRTILDDLIQEIGSLLAYAQSLADKSLDKPIDPAVVKKLEEMEKAVALLKETTIKEAMEFGITEEEMTRGIHKMPEGMTANQERVWKRLNELRWDAEGM